MSETARVLLKAAEVLQEHRLAKGQEAKDASGEWCPAESPEAVSFCALGSIWRAAYELDLHSEKIHAEDALAHAIGEDADIADWNDVPSRRKGQVVAKLREAAKAVA